MAESAEISQAEIKRVQEFIDAAKRNLVSDTNQDWEIEFKAKAPIQLVSAYSTIETFYRRIGEGDLVAGRIKNLSSDKSNPSVGLVVGSEFEMRIFDDGSVKLLPAMRGGNDFFMPEARFGVVIEKTGEMEAVGVGMAPFPEKAKERVKEILLETDKFYNESEYDKSIRFPGEKISFLRRGTSK